MSSNGTTPAPEFHGYTSPNYTQVPDELFDQQLPDLTGAELKVLLYIMRRTFGFKKDADNISLNQISRGITTQDGRVLDRGTGLSQSTVQVALKGLIAKCIVLATKRMSKEKGNEATTYQLNLGSPFTENRWRATPKLDEGLHRKSVTQETVIQETEKNSKFERHTPDLEKNEDETVPAGDAAAPVANVAPDAQLPVDELHSASVTHAADDSQPTPTDSMGFQQFKERALTQRAELNREEKKAGRRGQRQTATAAPEPVHAVLTERARLIVDRIHADAVPGEQAVTVPEPASPAISAQRRGRPPGSREEREHLTAYLMDWLRQFNDQAPVSSISRALNDFRAANVPCERWGDYLHQAKSILRENQAKVTTKAVKQTNNLQPHNLTPYYFEILEDLLGLREGTNQTTAIVHSP